MSTSRTWSIAPMLMVAVLAAGGCEPPPMVSAVPPGIDPRESLAPKEEPSEAIGETPKRNKPNTLPGLVPAPPTAKGVPSVTPSGVTYETIKEGTGGVVTAGQQVTIHYVGTLDDGRKFDSSRDRSEPMRTAIGTGAVIKGWDEAVPGMKVGEVRKLTIPPAAGYGALGSGERVPPNATLHFEIEVISAE